MEKIHCNRKKKRLGSKLSDNYLVSGNLIHFYYTSDSFMKFLIDRVHKHSRKHEEYVLFLAKHQLP